MIINVNSKVLLIAVYLYLDNYFDQGSDELGDFLSSLFPTIDGSPADTALYEDWREVVNKQENLKKEEAYNYMFKFLKMQGSMGWPEINKFIKKNKINAFSKNINIQQLTLWNDSINKALEYNIQY